MTVLTNMCSYPFRLEVDLSQLYVFLACSGSNGDQMLSRIEFIWPALMIASSAFQAGASIIKVRPIDNSNIFTGTLRWRNNHNQP